MRRGGFFSCAIITLSHYNIKKRVDTTNMGGRTYPVRYYPVAIRLRDRKGRAILCIALFPQSGDSSGAILGVRSVALLHARCSPYYRHSHFIYKKIGFALILPLLSSYYERAPIVEDKSSINRLKINYYLIKKCSFICVCAFFVVPLRTLKKL